MKEKLYRKEIWITIVFSALLMLMGHSASLQGGTLWGFPVEYIVPILLGWFGIAIVCLVMTLVCNKFDDEMEAYASRTAKDQEKVLENE